MADRVRYISDIAALPEQLKNAVAALDDEQLDTPYRPGGWTVRQVVHHLADSHMNSYIRFKLALTEDEPLIKPYAEDQWAEIEEARRGPVGVSLTLLSALHARWVQTLAGMDEADFQRAFRHPELGAVRLDMALALYAWHGKHHLGHIAQVAPRGD
jgi:uncharacterized damage-inducible protein DinB